MAKFIKVTRISHTGEDNGFVVVNIKTIDHVEQNGEFVKTGEKFANIYQKGWDYAGPCKSSRYQKCIGRIKETPEEIHALIQEAQGAGEVEEELDIDLCDAISVAIESGEVDPGDILQMVKDAVK